MDSSAKINISTNFDKSQLLFCDGVKPFYWSDKDTIETVKQAKILNQIGIKECNWK
jgi:hypothetical protein